MFRYLIKEQLKDNIDFWVLNLINIDESQFKIKKIYNKSNNIII